MDVKEREQVKYKILKDFSKGNLKVNNNTYQINSKEFASILLHMENEKLINGISVAGANTNHAIVFWESAEITSVGLKYLEESSFKRKVFNIAKPTGKALNWVMTTIFTIIGIILVYLALE